ncbi:hypothetical protein B5V01_22095 [Mesorhizobium erdmanii]|uniref:Uncharacterized protein n=2 Tax=Mesorhizobium TaxID=68287 RepID=A0A3M9X3Z1_9HYPH|nr:hypothetical protein DNR46_26710 [Mesorhizobium japonicum]RXT42583.1 hypothetical protein B5V01_22095 [Mesorhizobium erdmanii]
MKRDQGAPANLGVSAQLRLQDGTSLAQSTLEAVLTVYPELAEMTMAIGSEVLNSPGATEDFS